MNNTSFLQKSSFIWIFTGAVLLYISSRLADKIINEPWWLILSVLIVASYIGFRLSGKFFEGKEKDENGVESKTYKFFFWIFWLTITAALTIILLTPFRFAIVQASNYEPSEAVVCEIKSVYKKKSTQKFFVRYEVKGHSKKIRPNSTY